MSNQASIEELRLVQQQYSLVLNCLTAGVFAGSHASSLLMAQQFVLSLLQRVEHDIEALEAPNPSDEEKSASV